MTVVIGTAGHIDHGKTSLLRALTGTDADRLPEEQRRGLTIDVGYAHASPDNGAEVDFVDVPGHDRLVPNMLVGAGEIDAALLVVAADDGPRAQTWEHIELLDALAIRAGLVAVTKTDLVDESRVAAVIEATRDGLAGTSLSDAQILPVSSRTGQGLDRLRTALAGLRDSLAPDSQADDSSPARMAIDRAFTIRGRGRVVTGSARGRAIRAGDRLTVVPGGSVVRVRGLQVHDADVDTGPHGGRLALAVAGPGVEELRRGQVLIGAVGSAYVLAVGSTDRFLVALHPPGAPGRVRDPGDWPPRDGQGGRLHLGTDQADVTIGRAGRDEVDLPQGWVTAIARLDRPIAAAVGDRFVIRRPPPAGLLAGGLVLDRDPTRGRSRRRQTPERLARLALAVGEGRRELTLAALLDLHGLLDTNDGPLLATDVEAAAGQAAIGAVGTHHREHPEEPGLALASVRSEVASAIRDIASATGASAARAAEHVVDVLLGPGTLEQDSDRVRLPDHRPPARDPALDRSMERLVALLDSASPPSLSKAASEAGCPAAGVRELERSDRIVRVDDDLAWSTPAYEALRSQALLMADGAPLTPAALRDATGTSRKYVMALLEDLGRRGILRRTSAGHVRGPRA